MVVTSSVAPSTVTAGQPTTISWQVTHGATLTYNAVAVSGPGGSGLPFGACATPTQVSGTATDGYFHEVCTVPNGLANGTYQTHIQVTDNLGNLTFVSGPSFSVVNSTVVAPPVVVTSSVAPSTVTAGQPTTISWQVTHGATLTYNAVAVSGPGGSGLPFGACATPTQVSGTATDGYFHEVCTVPNGLANGTYQTHIQVTDNLGNLTFVSGPSFSVVNSTVVAPPVVVTSSVAPSTVTAGQPTTISWQVTHGATLTYNAVAVSGPGGSGLPFGACATPTQVSGTATDGYFHEVCTVPNGLANGTYQTHIQVTDNLGNLTFVSGPSFKVGLPPSPPTVNDLPTDATYGGSFAATVTTTGDGTTSVTSSSPGVCTVSGATVSYVGAGTCSLAAHVAAGAHYSTAAGSPQTFTVSPAATATSVSTNPTSVPQGASVTYAVAVTSSVGTPAGTASVSIGSTAVCVVTLTTGSGSCTSTTAPVGLDTVTASYGGSNNFSSSTATSSLRVTAPPVPAPPVPAPVPAPTPPTSGFDLVGSDGGVFVLPTGSSGGYYGSLPGLGIAVNDIAGMVPTSDNQGYFLVGADGGVFSFGNAPFLGSLPGIGVKPAQPITGIVPTGTNGGYFMVGRDGGVYAFGNAPFLGSLPGDGISVSNIVGIAATPSGNGYWLVAANGTVYAFGAAQQLGSATRALSPVSAIAGTPNGAGYWIATQNGTVYAFGNAKAFSTLPALGVTPARPVIGIVPTADTAGYWLIGSDGGTFSFGDAGFVGSLPGLGADVTDIVGAVPTRE